MPTLLTASRDQELRFTVHESPDYYKVKCSIFNDDKKTDLIGETWIDLKEVIVPGGGQNDLWHQLNFKGKYAGDIRMEMTYYDTRIHPEPESDKRRNRNKAHSSASDGMSSASSARQLGPREIKRRPLPPGPGQPQLNEMPAPLNIQLRHPQPPPQTHAHSHCPPHPHPQPQWMPSETPEDYRYPEPHQSQYETSEGYFDNAQHSQGVTGDQYRHDYFDEPGDTFMPMYDSQTPQQTPPTAHYNEIQHGSSPHSHTTSPYTPQHSSPPVRQSPPSVPQDSQRENRMSMSPTKYMPYRDSPLRQSISQQEVPLPAAPFDPEFEEAEPPPPPAHRGSLPRASGPTAFNTPPQAAQHRQPPPRPNTIDDRSPLQMIEHQYSPHTPLSNRSSGRRLSHLSQQDQLQEKPMPVLPAETAVVGDFPAPHQLSMNYGVDFVTDPVEQDRQGRYIRRNSAVESPDFQRPPQRSQTFDAPEVFDERNTFRSEPRLVRPRAVSPSAAQTVPRKSVSPHPNISNDPSRMGGIPFGPDSYDVLNPGSSPTSHGHPTPEPSAEAARQREVNKMRDQGPIIGNDGRVIDPSDHLPSDTWAPEPERKNRKPEHVIHVRRKNESHQRADSSPTPVKPLSVSNSPYQGPPQTPVKPMSATNSPYHSPVDPGSAPNSGRRNRLQKQLPQRPLPTQPHAHPHSSPSSIPQVRTINQPSLGQQRNSMPSSPMSGPPPRPSLSEYQVPVASNYNPRNSYHPQQQHQSTPPRMPPMPQRPQSFAYGGYDDPLAAEMSMIDLGPSRGGGRTALRSSRGYSGY